MSAAALAATSWLLSAALLTLGALLEVRNARRKAFPDSSWRDGAFRWLPAAWLAAGACLVWYWSAGAVRDWLADSSPVPAAGFDILQSVATFALLAFFVVRGCGRLGWRRGNPFRRRVRADLRRERALRARIRQLVDDPVLEHESLDTLVDYAELDWLEDIAAHLERQERPRRLALAIDEPADDDPAAIEPDEIDSSAR